jgi:hypothetical protein
MEIGCKLAVLGTAVACTLTGSVAGFGPVEAAAIVGYSPDEQLVHWTEISSTDEYHDHRGSGRAIRLSSSRWCTRFLEKRVLKGLPSASRPEAGWY